MPDFLAEILKMQGVNAVRVAITTLLAGRVLERLRYLLTGDIGSLLKKVGP
jgi:hypothetical protein